jgi:hypothetical protein
MAFRGQTGGFKVSVYAISGKPTIEVDLEYFYLIQKDSELFEILKAHGVEDWEGYKAAEQEYKDEVGE